MLNQKKIEILKKKYNISQKELENLGLLKIDADVLCTSLTEDEHEKIFNISIERDISASEIVRKYIFNMLKNNKINTKAVKSLKNKKIIAESRTPFTLRLESKHAKDFKDLCKKNYVTRAAVLRYIVVTVINKEGGLN